MWKSILHFLVMLGTALTGWPFPLYHWLRGRNMFPATPNFNLECDVWKFTTLPISDPPAFALVRNQLYVPSTGAVDLVPTVQGQFVPPIYIRFGLSDEAAWSAAAIVETPRQTQRYYLVRWKQRIHEGFPNEYLCALVEQCDAHGVPIYRDVVSYAQAANFVLTETGELLAAESGDAIILE